MNPDEIRAGYRARNVEIYKHPSRVGEKDNRAIIKAGDIIRGVGSGDAWICTKVEGGVPILEREIAVHNASEWLLVGRVKG